MSKITMWKITNWVFRIIAPTFWVQIGESDWEWDLLLNKLLDSKPKVSDLDGFKCKLNGMGVWISNYPYAYGNAYTGLVGKESGLPAPLTRRRLRKYLKRHVEAEDNKHKNKNQIELHVAVEEALNKKHD